MKILPTASFKLIFSSFLLIVCLANAQTTAFTFQGRLNDGASAADGSYDFTFALFSVENGEGQVGNTITNLDIAVSNGLFTVALDFGNQFPGAARWLEIGVRTNGSGAFTSLIPRQPITASPYSIKAAQADAVPGLHANPISSSIALGFNTTASGASSTASGLETTASGFGATAMGLFGTVSGTGSVGLGYFASASGDYSVALGSSVFANAPSSMAVGHWATANHPGSFVWADNHDLTFTSTSSNQFLIRAEGGVGINTNNPNGAALAVNGSLTVNGVIAGNGSGLTNMSVNSLVRTTTNFSIVAWGNNHSGQTTIPVGLNNVAGVAVGGNHSLALKTDGTVIAWGENFYGQANVPAGLNNVAAVAAGETHSLALKTDGTVIAWGRNDSGQTNVPPGLNNVAAVTAGGYHSLALKTDGTVVVWGNNTVGQTNVPAGLSNVTAVAAGSGHVLALKSDGTVVSWGYNVSGQTNIPVGLNNVAGVAAGGSHSLALKTDGTVVSWGDNFFGQTNVPAGLSNVVAVATGSGHGLALKSDGTVVAWGSDSSGQTNVPAGLSNVIAVASGPSGSHVMVIRQQPSSPMAWLDADNMFNGNIQVNGTLSGNGAGLTSLNAANLSGSVPSTSLTSVPAESLTGTIADALLSTSVALRTGGNNFTGNQTITGGSVGIGIAPQSTLHVNGTARIQGADNWDVNNTEGDFRVGNDVQRFKIGVATGGGGAGDIWMRAQGGTARVFIKTPGGTTFYSNEGQTAGVSLAASGTAWAVVSDRNVKKDFADVDAKGILEKLAAMPITQWHYQWEEENVTPHIGPMAQDFKAAFYPGSDDKSITTQEADGVAFAAIKGLNQKLEQKETEIAELKQSVQELKELVGKLSQKMERSVK